MSTGYTVMNEWLTGEARRLTAAGGPNKLLALSYIRLSHMVPPHALIHKSQQEGVSETLFMLLDRDLDDGSDEVRHEIQQEIARDIRDATIFLAACTTF